MVFNEQKELYIVRIFSIRTKAPVSPEIKYRRMLNKLNLEAREKIATLDLFAPFETAEKQKELLAIEEWKQGQKTAIYERCFNPQPSVFERLINFIRRR